MPCLKMCFNQNHYSIYSGYKLEHFVSSVFLLSPQLHLIPTNNKACYWSSYIYKKLMFCAAFFHRFFFLVSPSVLPSFSSLVFLHAMPPRLHPLELHTLWWWWWWWWLWRWRWGWGKLRWYASLRCSLKWTQWVASHMCFV